MDDAKAGPLLVKRLAACDKATRDKAVRTLLKTWLPAQSEVPDEEMKRLWKGLFYCVWHADKLPVQVDLIEKLSSVLPSLEPAISLHYFSVFLLTMRREWTGIDGLRLDKFYLLIRRFLHYSFVMMKKWSWDLDFTRRSMCVLVERTFLDDDNLLGNGVNYHIASIFLEEIRPFLPLRKEVLEVVLEPIVRIMGKVADKVLISKIKSNVFALFLNMGRRLLQVKRSEAGIDSGDDVVVLGTIALVMGFSAKFYELGSSAECCQGNRKVLLGLHGEFLKLEKDLESSGIEISIPDVLECDEGEVPELVPIAEELETNGSDAVPDPSEVNANGSGLKKCKKVKKGKKPSDGSAKNPGSTPARKADFVATENSDNSSVEGRGDGDMLTFDESVMSNLQKQFEKVAAEAGLDDNVSSACEVPKVTANGNVSKKRKRSKSMDGKRSQNAEVTIQGDDEDCATAKTGEKSVKRVRFSMKNNLVWKPHSPLPPQSLRLPPSVTPRGSALKQGLSPGPIREMSPLKKKVRKAAKSMKKGQKARKNPAVKRPKKLKSLSP